MTMDPRDVAPADAPAASFLAELSRDQHRAVTAPLGPVLVMAGAGSGKTRVLTCRAAWLLHEVGALPREVVALTFTNKAAREMRERMVALVPGGGRPPFFGTFHAFSIRLLRRFAARLSLPPTFSVLAGREQSDVLRRAAEKAKLTLPPQGTAAVLRAISREKCGLHGKFPDEVDGPKLMAAYQKEARAQGAVDFDDMLLMVRELLRTDREVRELLAREIRHVLVDEFQDTNAVQYDIMRLLAPPGSFRGESSLFAVGDDDQSIYAFRGAQVGNILAFDKDYSGTVVVQLERNYRSTPEILTAATGIVKANRRRREKRVSAHRSSRGPVELVVHATEGDEARWVTKEVGRARDAGSVAILFRTNAQSRSFEEALTASGIPYRVVGALRFYERREVKDLLAYVAAILVPQDRSAFARALSSPPRGVGEKSLSQLEEFALARQMSLREAIRPFLDGGADVTARVREGLSGFADLLDAVEAAGPGAHSMLDLAMKRAGFKGWLEKDPDGRDRLENLAALLSAAEAFDREHEGDDDEGNEGGAAAFLAYASLESADEEEGAEGSEGQADRVSLLTLHAAKGLEFQTVYLAGVEEGLLPHAVASQSLEDVEEERRLMYVGMTRAMDRLVLTRALERRVFGKPQRTVASRFLADLPPSVRENDLSPEQDPGARFERALAFFGTSEGSPPARSFPTRSAPSSPDRPAHRPGAAPPPAFSPSRPPASAPAFAPKAPSKVDPNVGPYGVGSRVRHDKFGVGVILGREGEGDDTKLTISFLNGVGRKKIILKHARLTVIG